MLEAGPPIEVEAVLDPMTAVGTPALHCFAESGEWTGESSTRRVGKNNEKQSLQRLFWLWLSVHGVASENDQGSAETLH